MEKWNVFSVFRQIILERETGADTSAVEARFERRWLCSFMALTKALCTRSYIRALSAASVAEI
jgi:hypothetical protein